MTLLESKIKQLIDELSYSDDKIVRTDRKSLEFVMQELSDWAIANQEIINI